MTNTPNTIKLKLSSITLPETNIRTDMGDMTGLAASMKKDGLAQPIIVSTIEDNKTILVHGYRRFKAAEMLKWEEIDARSYESLNQFERARLQVEIQLVHQKNLTWQEEVALKAQLHNSHMAEVKRQKREGKTGQMPWSQTKTAAVLGMPNTTLSEELRLAEALKAFPELAKVNQKTDAIRKMYRLREIAILQELSRRRAEQARLRGDLLGMIDEKEEVNFINADCLEVLPKMEDESVDLIITDPPWGINLTENTGAKSLDYKVFNDSGEEGLRLYRQSIPHLYRLLRPGGHLYIFFGMEHYAKILRMLQRAANVIDIEDDKGFSVRFVPCVWVKDRPGYTAWEYQPMPQYESFFFCVKDNPRKLIEATSDVFTYKRTATSETRISLTEKPVELIKRLILLSSNKGDLILDPFAGSGATLIASLLTGRRAIGIEKDQEIWSAADGRVAKARVEIDGGTSV